MTAYFYHISGGIHVLLINARCSTVTCRPAQFRKKYESRFFSLELLSRFSATIFLSRSEMFIAHMNHGKAKQIGFSNTVTKIDFFGTYSTLPLIWPFITGVMFPEHHHKPVNIEASMNKENKHSVGHSSTVGYQKQ